MRPTTMALVAAVGLVHWAVPSNLYAMDDPRTAFQDTDTNRDGVVDHPEFQERLVWVFYKADTNKDGYLDAQELQLLVFPQDFATLDRDHDTRVSQREFLRVRFLDYDRADTDHDGVLSLDEVVAGYQEKGKKQ